MFNEEKFAEWNYCKTCVSRDLDEEKEPCARCILLCIATISQKPVNYVERGDDVNV